MCAKLQRIAQSMRFYMETWKSIAEFQGQYEVSNLGRVRSVDRYVDNNGTRQLLKGQMRKPYLHHTGYLCVNLLKNNKRYPRYIHRLVALAFIPNPANLPCVNHKDENKQNNNVVNLEWCTQSYNSRYNNAHVKRGNKLKGIKHNRNPILQIDKSGKEHI